MDKTEMRSTLESLGLTRAEFRVLEVVHEYPVPREKCAVLTYEEDRGDPQALSHCEDYLEAVRTCCTRQWLHEVTLADELAYRQQRLKETFLVCDECMEPECVGSLDLTPAGYALYQEAGRRVFGKKCVGSYYDSVALVLYVLADTRDHCMEEVQFRLRQHSRDLQGDDPNDWVRREVVAASEPSPVTQWRRSRHEVVQGGFCAKIRYRLVPIDKPPWADWTEKPIIG